MNSKLNTGKNLHVNNTINSRKQQKQMQRVQKKTDKGKYDDYFFAHCQGIQIWF